MLLHNKNMRRECGTQSEVGTWIPENAVSAENSTHIAGMWRDRLEEQIF